MWAAEQQLAGLDPATMLDLEQLLERNLLELDPKQLWLLDPTTTMILDLAVVAMAAVLDSANGYDFWISDCGFWIRLYDCGSKSDCGGCSSRSG